MPFVEKGHGALEDWQEAQVAGIVTDKDQIRFSRFSQMREGSPWKTTRWGMCQGVI